MEKISLPYQKDSAALFEVIADLPWAVFLDSGPPSGNQGRYDIFSADPYVMLTTRGKVTEIRSRTQVEISPENPFDLVKKILGQKEMSNNELPFCGGAIGYFGYDLARRIEKLPVHATDEEKLPEMVIGIYDWAVIVDHEQSVTWLVHAGRDSKVKFETIKQRFAQKVAQRFRIPFRVTGKILSNMNREKYFDSFNKIQSYIHNGDCYQVNLAQRFAAPVEGDAWLAYQSLRIINPAPFSAYFNTPYAQILSTSPERFLKLQQGKVETKPIKGTRRRSGHPGEDAKAAMELATSIKDRAENVMIVDLLRNDLGKNCLPGSVKVNKLFAVESFATVHHLVSTITGQLDPQRSALDLLAGCFPGGSITGAPKLRAMEIIEELEPCRRGVYCGAIGYIGFDGNMDTNIAIRTLVNAEGKIRFWAGGGIIADSKAEEEYQETFDKAAALTQLLERVSVNQINNI